MFAWHGSFNYSQQRVMSSHTTENTIYMQYCIDIIRECLLSRELDKAAIILSILFYEFKDFTELCIKVASEFFRLAPTDSSLDNSAFQFYDFLLKQKRDKPELVIIGLMELTRYYWRTKKFKNAYDIWLEYTTNSFYALTEIEITTMLGLTSFYIWNEEDEDNSTSENENRSNDSISEDDEIENPISQIEDSINKNNTTNNLNDVFKDTISTNEKIQDILDNDKILNSFRLKKHNNENNELSLKDKKIQNRILQIEANSVREDDSFFYKTKEYFILALEYNPCCETSLFHLVQLLLFEELYKEARKFIISFCEDNPLNPFGFRFLACLLETYFIDEVNYRIQVYAKILDMDPICSNSFKKLLSIYKDGNTSKDILQLCFNNFFEEYSHLINHLDLTEEEYSLLKTINKSSN